MTTPTARYEPASSGEATSRGCDVVIALHACIRCDEPMASDELFCQTCVVWSQDVELAEAPDA